MASGSVWEVVGPWFSRLFANAAVVSGGPRHNRRGQWHFGSRMNRALMPGIIASLEIEQLEVRAVLDADWYGTVGGILGGPTTYTAPPSTGTTTAPKSTTIPPISTTIGSTGSTTTMTGSATFGGTFLSSTSSFAWRPNGEQWFETFGTDPLSGVVSENRDLTGGLSQQYSSDTAAAKPIIPIDTTSNSTSVPTGPLTNTLRIGEVTQSSVMIDHTGIQQGSPLRIVLQATSNFPSGKYDAQIQVVASTGMISLTQTLAQNVLVENRESSLFGRGWAITGLEQLVPQAGGSVFLSGVGLPTDAAGWIHIGGPNEALNQAGWTDQLLLQFANADVYGNCSATLSGPDLIWPGLAAFAEEHPVDNRPPWLQTIPTTPIEFDPAMLPPWHPHYVLPWEYPPEHPRYSLPWNLPLDHPYHSEFPLFPGKLKPPKPPEPLGGGLGRPVVGAPGGVPVFPVPPGQIRPPLGMPMIVRPPRPPLIGPPPNMPLIMPLIEEEIELYPPGDYPETWTLPVG